MNERSDFAAESGREHAGARFDALLRRLRSDGADGVGYETLRRRLIRFFRLHVPPEAEALADVVLDRLARRIHEGTEVESVPSYALGIARLVLHEARARAVRHHRAEVDPTLSPADAGTEDDATEALLGALMACLDDAGAEARRLILAYYAGDGAGRIAMRRSLAVERGVSLNALRNRALRLRDALEACVRSRTKRDGEA